ncbi:hypothetical protein [Clostridioides sp. ZZV15-6597]|uniref:hypothetical protein n=1 Tax=Clostridioides sp. ZZV15-6597 TaxID=2811500 RepID=UPI001D1115A2|nr:hypothetical protein [Clostridioides sp. ZZV15-6597]
MSNIKRIYNNENNNNFEIILEKVVFDALDKYIKEKYNLREINNATSSYTKGDVL